MPSEDITLLASATKTSSDTGSFVDVSEYDFLAVHVNLTALDALTTAKFYLVGTADDETTQVRIPLELRTNFDGTTALATEATEIGDRLGSAASLPEQAVAILTRLPWSKVAIEWSLSGGGPSCTFSAFAAGGRGATSPGPGQPAQGSPPTLTVKRT